MRHEIRKQEQMFTSFSAKQTWLLGTVLAKELLQTPLRKKATVIALQGELGSGKTTFVQGFAYGLGVREKILSPTFVILKKFKIQEQTFQYFYHIDCYRVERAKDILDLGWKEIISRQQHIVIVEWADRIKKILPKDTISISFETTKEHERKITFP